MPDVPLQQPSVPSIIPAPKQPSRWEAQRHFGLIAGLDYTAWAVCIFSWITLGFWWLFGQPGAVQLLAFAVFNIFLAQVYIVILIFRALVFLLDLGADINLMPEAAARIVLGFWEGRRK